MTKKQKKMRTRILLAFILFLALEAAEAAAAQWLSGWVGPLLFLIPYGIIGWGVLDRAVQGPPYLHSLFIRPDRSRSRGAGQSASRRFLLGTTRRGTAAPLPGFPPQTPRDAWRREREWRIHKNGPPGDHPAGRFP